MAVVILDPLVAHNVSGSSGGITVYGLSCTKRCHSRIKGNIKALLSLQMIKGYKRSLQYTWGSALSQAQRDTWNTYATTHQLTNSKGTLHTVTGYQLYLALNTNLHTCARSSIADPPPDTNFSDIEDITLTQPANPSPPPLLLPQVLLSTGVTPPAGDYIVIDCAKPRAPGATAIRKREPVHILIKPATETQPFDVTSSIAARFGTIQLNKTYQMSAYTVRGSNGARGPKYDATIVLS